MNYSKIKLIWSQGQVKIYGIPRRRTAPRRSTLSISRPRLQEDFDRSLFLFQRKGKSVDNKLIEEGISEKKGFRTNKLSRKFSMKVKKEDPTTTEHLEASEDDHSALTPLAHDIQTDFSVEPCPTTTPFMSRSKTFDSFDHRKQQRNQVSIIFIHRTWLHALR